MKTFGARAVFVAAAVCPVAAQMHSLSLSKLTFQEAGQRLQAIEKELSDALTSIPPVPPKDQFETTADYQKRNQAWFALKGQRTRPLDVEKDQLRRHVYVDGYLTPDFQSYDADSETLTAGISGENCLFKVSPGAAKDMHDSWSKVSVARSLPDENGPSANLQTRNQAGASVVALVSGERLYFGKSSSRAPTVVSRADPEYSAEARAAKLNGSVMLSLIVGIDGKATEIKVTKGVGMGIDEKAIEAIQKWRFKPATRNCLPVEFRSQIEVNFRML
jgi:TonB family protein